MSKFWERKRKRKRLFFVFPSSTKREIRHFLVVVAQRRLRNVQKSMTHVPKLLFCQSKPIIAFLLFSLSEITHVRESKTVLDSRFRPTQEGLDFRDWIPEFWIPNLHCKIKWRILIATYVDTSTLINKLSKMTRNVK